MYPEFDYKLQKSTLIVGNRWLAWSKKIGQIRYTNEWDTKNKMWVVA